MTGTFAKLQSNFGKNGQSPQTSRKEYVISFDCNFSKNIFIFFKLIIIFANFAFTFQIMQPYR